MESIELGRTHLNVSRIGFGGIPIQRLSEERAVNVVRRALDLGVTFIDTANAYTTSEARIGRTIGGRRGDLVIATKTGARDKSTAEQHLALSLERLKTDYIDLWQLHNVSSFEAYKQVLAPGGALEAAQEALAAGKIGHIGITSHLMEVALEAVTSGHFETIQFPFNFVTDEARKELIPLADAHGLGFISMKPFAGGLLDQANLVIKYQLQFDSIVPDPGIETEAEIEEIVDIVEGSQALTPAEREAIEQIRASVETVFCRRCGYCQPCPQEIPIPMLMNVRSFWQRFSEEWFFDDAMAGAIKKARTCIACGECEQACPYDLPIREMVNAAIVFYDEVYEQHRAAEGA